MEEPFSYPPFPGFSDEAFQFLRDLSENNDRDWFKPRKETYETELKTPLELLLADAARRLDEADLPLTAHPSTSRFRIYRDVRFTDDKTPYKTHVGAVFDRTGEKDESGVVYVHVEPESSFLAAGFYSPSVSYLRPVRRRMAEAPEQFYSVLETMEKRGLPVDSMDDTLTGMPRGFSDYRGQEIAPYLKWQHYLVRREYPDAALQTPAFAEEVVEMTRDSLPLLEFVWDTQPGT